MLYQIFLSIRSEYANEAFYQIFDANDVDYRIPLEGREEWLNSDNRQVEILIPVKFAKVKIGFRKQASYSGDWIAAPKLIDTHLGVLLNSSGKIEQRPAGFLNMGELSGANFLDNDVMRPIVGGLGKLAGGIIGELAKSAKDIPFGSIVSTIAGVIWPEPSVSSLIAASEIRMQNFIISQIRQMKLAQQEGDLGSIRDNLEEYRNAAAPAARARWIGNTIESCNKAKNQLFVGDDEHYTPGAVYLALDLAGIHLAILRERIEFETEIFGNEKVNTQMNLETLKKTVEEYQAFLIRGVKLELKERRKQIKLTYKNSFEVGGRGNGLDALHIRVLVTDHVRRQVHRFSINGSFNEIISNEAVNETKPIQPLIDMYMDQAINELEVRLQEDILIPAAVLDYFIPGKEGSHPVPLDRDFTVGPQSGLARMDFKDKDIGPIAWRKDKPGEIVRVQVVQHGGAGVTAHYFNFEYRDEGGKRRFSLGEEIGGPPVALDLKLKPGVFITKVESWWERYPIGVQLEYSDGSKSKMFGKKGNGLYQVAALAHHRVSRFDIGTNIEAFMFGFRLMPSFYKR